MKTVKEVSRLTGISVRTLHYYDEIGLFRPTEVKETGYRFYDDEAIDKLGQILVFRELDLPLADIKLIMDNPDLDRNAVLARQREMLCVKQQRIERIIAGIDEMMKGDQNMDLTVFDETQIRTMFTDMLQNMSGSLKQIFVDTYGSIEAWENHMMEAASDEKVQKNYAKVVEWYGGKEATKEGGRETAKEDGKEAVMEGGKEAVNEDGKEAAKEFIKNQPNSEIFAAYRNRIDDIQRRIVEKIGTDVASFEVRQLIGEYDFVAKQLYQIKDARPILLDIAKGYREDEKLIAGLDSVYGSGSAKYIGEAIESFYISPSKVFQ